LPTAKARLLPSTPGSSHLNRDVSLPV
jgi:hypothetical protein